MATWDSRLESGCPSPLLRILGFGGRHDLRAWAESGPARGRRCSNFGVVTPTLRENEEWWPKRRHFAWLQTSGPLSAPRCQVCFREIGNASAFSRFGLMRIPALCQQDSKAPVPGRPARSWAQEEAAWALEAGAPGCAWACCAQLASHFCLERPRSSWESPWTSPFKSPTGRQGLVCDQNLVALTPPSHLANMQPHRHTPQLRSL